MEESFRVRLRRMMKNTVRINIINVTIVPTDAPKATALVDLRGAAGGVERGWFERLDVCAGPECKVLAGCNGNVVEG
jgi:hypothetical protein